MNGIFVLGHLERRLGDAIRSGRSFDTSNHFVNKADDVWAPGAFIYYPPIAQRIIIKFLTREEV